MAGPVTIREVGPRDGLQVEAPVAPEGRIRLLEALAAAGIREVEAVSFVSPRAVPAMDGAARVLAGFRQPGVTRWALVPNVRGAQMALDAGADALSVTASASEAYSQRNVRMSIDEAVAEAGAIAGVVDGRLPIDAVISCAFGSPYEGDISARGVAALARRLADSGATTVTLADTTGMATPPRLSAALEATGVDVGLHLHDTRGTALVNAYAAVQLGVHRFDTSVGGLGGSPFAEGSAGNLATETFVYLLDELGIATSIDLPVLLGAVRLVSELIGHPVASRLASAGPRLPVGENGPRAR